MCDFELLLFIDLEKLNRNAKIASPAAGRRSNQSFFKSEMTAYSLHLITDFRFLPSPAAKEETDFL